MAPSPRALLVLRMRALARQLRADCEELGSLRERESRREEIEALLDDLDRQLERVRDAAVITLVGATGAGKSTLLNALVGADVALVGEARPTTHRPVVYAPADADLSELVDGLPGEAPELVRYEASSASGPWSEQVLVDAPDINSVAALHREVVQALADKSDALVVVLHRQSVAEDASVRFVDHFAGRRHLVFVLNRADELTDESRDRLLGDVRSLARDRWQVPDAPVLATSALAARTQPRTAGWNELCSLLADLVRDGALGAVRRHNAVGTARAIGRLFGDVRDEVADELAALPARVQAGVEELARFTAEEVAQRLRLRRPDFAALYCGEVAKRWDGPGGWALRGGGLASLGLGAGALLVRRNPLLAAGAAAGGLAAGKVRELSRRRQLAEPSELFPAQGEFESLYANALAEARLASARLIGSPDGYGVPDAELARERTARAVEEPWDRLLGRDLPAAAERSANALLRWTVDLPVYALVGWVVYLGVRGFFAGEYLGLDFLLNAVLLLAAYLFVARFLLRRVFDLASRRLLARVIRAVREALGGLGAEARARSEERAAATRAALDRLASLEASFRAELAREADGR